jgi:hypothetical protein
MSDRPPALAQPPSWAEPIPPPPGAWCRALRHKLVDRAARISRLALHDVPSAGAPDGRRSRGSIWTADSAAFRAMIRIVRSTYCYRRPPKSLSAVILSAITAIWVWRFGGR